MRITGIGVGHGVAVGSVMRMPDPLPEPTADPFTGDAEAEVARVSQALAATADDLAERGFSSSPLHGDMAQVAREKALAKFREDKIRVLVATDVAARGTSDGMTVLDFNFAYNPSCAYSPRYVCPLAPTANRLPKAVTAGERTLA